MSSSPPLVHFFTDFGADSPYPGLMEAALLRHCPVARVIHLAHDAPRFMPRHAGVLLAAMTPWLAEGSSVVAVVDPGVGGSRRAVVVEVAGRRYLAPDNGLLAPLLHQAGVRAWEIDAGAFPLSSSFHGRDLFAPAAGMLLSGIPVAMREVEPSGLVGWNWGDRLAEVIYIDPFGNAMTGLSPPTEDEAGRLCVEGLLLSGGRTFCERQPGTLFWYENSLGLVEIAANQARADQLLGLRVGLSVEWCLGSDGKAS